jgi:gamma-glutamyltranspeptidase/glutathione hydrolase
MPEGVPPSEGQLFRNPQLADTLEELALDGPAAFYRGRVAASIDRTMRLHDGPLRLSDFEAHTGEWVEPISVSYRDVDVYELPPNGQGVAVLQMLRILEGFDLRSMAFGSADALHHLIESKRLAFEDRAARIADPATYGNPTPGLLDSDYIDRRRDHISADRLTEIVPAEPLPLSGDTVCLSTADDSGMMVSLIQSNFLAMGSGIVAEGTGFGLQNRGALFTLETDHPNGYAPGKRPFHTIIPAFAFRDNRPWLAFGLMGGDMQPQGHVQVLTDLVDFDMGIQEACDAPRWRHEGGADPAGRHGTHPGMVFLESGIGQNAADELERRGHSVRRSCDGFGGFQAVESLGRDVGFRTASDRRKDGQGVAW